MTKNNGAKSVCCYQCANNGQHTKGCDQRKNAQRLYQMGEPYEMNQSQNKQKRKVIPQN